MLKPRSRPDFALYLDEIPQFSSFLVVALLCVLSKDFQALFWSVLKGFGFESMTTVECKQKIMDTLPREHLVAHVLIFSLIP